MADTTKDGDEQKYQETLRNLKKYVKKENKCDHCDYLLRLAKLKPDWKPYINYKGVRQEDRKKNELYRYIFSEKDQKLKSGTKVCKHYEEYMKTIYPTFGKRIYTKSCRTTKAKYGKNADKYKKQNKDYRSEKLIKKLQKETRENLIERLLQAAKKNDSLIEKLDEAAKK